jgi:hypothetical protein
MGFARHPHASLKRETNEVLEAFLLVCMRFSVAQQDGDGTKLTIVVDDAGIGDLLFGVVIGALRCETQQFRYDVLDVKYFRHPRFRSKEYLKQASEIVFQLLGKLELGKDELIQVCRGYIFDEAVDNLKETYGDERIERIAVTGEPQRLTEIAYLDEIRNLGYEPVKERDEKKAKSFFHMMNWLRKNPEKMVYAKTGWPRLQRYTLFKHYRQKQPRE